jgi:hypothetical protein
MTTLAAAHWHDASAYLSDFYASVSVGPAGADGQRRMAGLGSGGVEACWWLVRPDGHVTRAWDPAHLLQGYQSAPASGLA